MSKFFAIAAMLATLTALAQGGGQGVGNGDGGWLCRNNDEAKSVRWIRTFDLFEAENEWGRTLRVSDEPEMKQIETAIAGIEPLLPEFAAKVRVALETVKKNRHDVAGPLPGKGRERPVDDLPAITPDETTCANGTWERVQLAVMYENGWLDIDSNYFNHPQFKPTERAALLLHEAVYLVLRESLEKDPNSLRTRQIVGAMFSTQKAAEKAFDVKYILEHPEQANRETVESRDGHYKSVDQASSGLDQKQKLMDYFFARIQTKLELPKNSSENELLFQNFDKNARALGVSAPATRQFIESTGPVPVTELRKQVDALPAVEPANLINQRFDCLRLVPFGIALPYEGNWVGIFLRPTLFDAVEKAVPGKPLPPARPDNLLTIDHDEWLEKVRIDLNAITITADTPIEKGAVTVQYHATAIDTLKYLRNFGEGELLGFELHKNPKSSNYWDGDYFPLLWYCKAQQK